MVLGEDQTEDSLRKILVDTKYIRREDCESDGPGRGAAQKIPDHCSKIIELYPTVLEESMSIRKAAEFFYENGVTARNGSKLSTTCARAYMRIAREELRQKEMMRISSD